MGKAAIFVMAQGSQLRMARALPMPKQFALVNGEPIIRRTIRLLGAHPSTVVADPLGTQWDWSRLGAPVLTLAVPGPNIVQGVIGCQAMWGEDNLFLLGDVVYSRATLTRIMSEQTEGMLVWGRSSENPVLKRNRPEMYALRFGKEGAQRFCEKAIPFGCRNLHDIRERVLAWDEFREVCDYTDDIDYPEDLDGLVVLGQAVAEEGP